MGLCFVAGAVDTGHALDPLGRWDGDGDGGGAETTATASLMEDLWLVLCAGARSTGIGELRGILGALDFTKAAGGKKAETKREKERERERK